MIVSDERDLGLNSITDPDLLLWYDDKYLMPKEGRMNFKDFLKRIEELVSGGVCPRIEYDKEQGCLVLRLVMDGAWYFVLLDDKDLKQDAITFADEVIAHLRKP